MASNLQIHKPYALKELSRPLARPDGPGKYTIGDVFGQTQGSKKRKRSELAVAIDGDSVHLYEIPSSQAITSYLVSPQSFFTCAPYSLRWRPSETKTTSRYTYISTQDAKSSKTEIKLFKDVTAESGTTSSTTASYLHRPGKPIVHISAVSRNSVTSLPSEGPSHEIVAVAADGTIVSLNGETLEKKWQSAPTVLTQDLPTGLKAEIQVEFVQSALAADAIDGMFGGNNDLFGVFREKVHREGFNPEILVLVTSSKAAQAPSQRYLHILALPTDKGVDETAKQNVIPVFAAPLPTTTDAAKFQLDVRSGTLQQLSSGTLFTFTFNSGFPRLDNKLVVPEMTSFLRLSKTSVLAATPSSLSVYNPVYQSVQTTTPLDGPEESESGKKKSSPCELVAYLPSREIAVGVRGFSLVAVQIEVPKGRNGKRRAEGLLTDALRRGLPRDQTCQKHSRAEAPATKTDVLPEPIDISQPDEYLSQNDLKSFEKYLANTFKMSLKKEKKDKPNGVPAENAGNEVAATGLPGWKLPSNRSDYPEVDSRWVFYAISRVFGWEDKTLVWRLPESNVLNYLVDAGHLTTPNFKSAFKGEVLDVDEVDEIIGETVSILLADVDPTLQLLTCYISGTQLGPTELVSATKLILRSLDLLKDPSRLQDLSAEKAAAEGENEVISMELDRAEEELQITEYYLGTDASRRAVGLSVAFRKLSLCPAPTTVKALRRLLKPEEIMCLMNVLRMELIRDGWTTRYLDQPFADDEEDIEAPPDGSIKLIADLLSRCIDSVGLGGWMGFDTQQADSVDFFSQFQAEVSVALEGVLEAVRLQGTLAEAVNYAKRAAKAAAETPGKAKALAIQERSVALPFGLKTETKISLERVRSGAEVVPRSSRQIGLFASQKRRSYSLHRITEDSLMEGYTGKSAA